MRVFHCTAKAASSWKPRLAVSASQNDPVTLTPPPPGSVVAPTCSFNPGFRGESPGHTGWISHGYYGIDQGPVVLMIENHRSRFLWELMKRCPFIVDGLRRAGFTGGWL